MNVDNLLQYAYTPYSNCDSEWCVVEGRSGVFYPGVRIENISFPLTITQLHGAICSCLANGDVPVSFFSEQENTEHQSYLVKKYNLKRRSALSDGITFYQPYLTGNHQTANLLEELLEKAVTPHSHFPVSALLYTEKGVVAGVNVELESWTLGLCAERLAIFRAVSSGAEQFNKFIIFAPKGDFSSPCGACRQVLMEWMPDKTVELHHGDHSVSTHRIADLLPFAFSSSKLTK